MSAQFRVAAASGEVVARLQQRFGFPRFLASVLASRGIDTPEEVEAFLHPSLENDWRDPYEIPGLEAAVDALEEAVRNKERIVVFGDFDLDGISATTVLARGLRALGAHADPFIPRRFEEGYGLTMEAYERAKGFAPDLIVTVDCGIVCRDEARAIVEDGVKVVITDHHEASDSVPIGVPVCDPKLDADCKSAILAGVGVALKVVQALGSRFGYPHLWRSYTDLATLGTIADLMPMVGENRALVADGVERMNTQPRPCLAALIGVSGAGDKPLGSTSISFSLAPRLNAAGRMGDAQLALDLLMCDDFDEANRLAEQLEAVNDQRRAIEAELSEMAMAQAAEIYDGQRALVVAGEGWHEGVKGIVASRLVNTYGVPTLLFTIEGDEARGSGRSVGNVNLFRAVESCSDLLIRFGGHGAAVGVTVAARDLPEFARRLDAYMRQLPEDDFQPSIPVDAEVRLDELTLQTVRQLDELAPFGQENPVPLFLARNVMISNGRAVGAGKNHFSCTLTDGVSSVAAIMFHCDRIEEYLKSDRIVDAAFTVQIDEWRGRYTVKAIVEALEPKRCCEALHACLDPEAVAFASSLFDEGTADAPVEESMPDPAADEAQTRSVRRREARERWRQAAQADPAALEAAIIEALIGAGTPHRAQRDILDALDRGESVLAVMATGRGKSLVFQTHAAKLALGDGLASVFVYPLRALIADQAFHLFQAFERFGLDVRVLTGESTPDQRAEVYDGLARGAVDIVLTTPEYLSYHADELGRCERIGFLVVDEAHHIGLAKAGQRLAYKMLRDIAHRLGDPTVLAVTATANDEVASDIEEQFPLDDHIVDETARENLHVVDRRGLKNRDDHLANLIASGGKTVIYVNSREQSVALARMLRRRVPSLALMIGFYNAGLSREERLRVEQMFRNDDLMVLVATSAFGEGIDIPNIRHVVLYHMPFNDIEFNQMAGRAGRDGKDAWIHLLYGRGDVRINESILSAMTPDHDVMAQMYRCLRSLGREQSGFFAIDAPTLAQSASTAIHGVCASAAACGLTVFRELGLIETRTEREGPREVLWVRVREDADRVELTDSVRYREGIDERDDFAEFCRWATSCDLEQLRGRVTHPIVPYMWLQERRGNR